MRRAIGPIVTTGVVLVGAAVVVANPLVTKPHDVTVPAVHLSAGAGTGAPQGMFDKALVDAIAVDTGDSTSPVSVLKQLFASLAADASLFGGKAVSEVLPHGQAATPPPSQAPSASPVDVNTLAALMQPALPAPASPAGQIGPELQQALTVVTADASYVGRQVVVAAIAAAGLTVTEPVLITEVVIALAKGDVTGAVKKVIDAAEAPLRPTSIILDAVRTVAGQHGVDLAASTAAVAGTRHAPTVAAQPIPDRVTRSVLQAADAQDAVDTATSGPAVPANGATDLTDGNKVTPTTIAPGPTHSDFAVREQIRTAVANFGAVVRKLAGLHPDDATSTGSDAAN